MTDSALSHSFRPAGLGEVIFNERYARRDEEGNPETWEEACRRLSHSASRAEVNGNADRYGKRFFDELVNGYFMPGGRHWYGAGRKVQQTANCFVVDADDSIEGWGKLMSDVAVISSKGGGVGINFSKIRPRGYPIGGMGGTATGAVKSMRIVNSIGEEIKDGGGRRAALMFCLNIDHPDIMEFLDAKLKVGELSNANISVVLPEDIPVEKFVDMVRNDENVPLRFHGIADREGRTVNARQLWSLLVRNAWQNGEPGVLNWHLTQKMNNIRYVRDLISVNPCSEQALSGGANCCLGAIVLPRFVKNGKMDWDKLDESIRLAVRYLDDTIDVADLPLPENAKVAQEERRIGLGVMGLHSMLLDLGLKYTSEDGLAFVDKVMALIKNTAYDASISLSIEKGPFPLYDERFVSTGFAKTLKRGLRNKIREHGIRNCCLLTCAPTGTTAMLHNVTGGLEPVFSPVYIRRRRVVDSKQREAISETLVVSKEYTDHPDLVEGAYDVSPRQHLEVQRIVQKHVDAALSKTTNLPKDFAVDDLGELWLEFLPDLKGTTFYREGSRETGDSFEPMKHIPLDQMADTLAEWTLAGKDIEYEDGSLVDDCAGGQCEV